MTEKGVGIGLGDQRAMALLTEIRGELRRLNIRLDSIDRRMDLEFGEMRERLQLLTDFLNKVLTEKER
jgi:hypothetical protein